MAKLNESSLSKTRNHSIQFSYLDELSDQSFSQVLQMPDFRSSAAGLHHFAVVKNLFHLVQLVALVTLPSFYVFVNRIVKKDFLSLYRKSLLALVVLPVMIGLGGVLIGLTNSLLFSIKFSLWEMIPGFLIQPRILLL